MRLSNNNSITFRFVRHISLSVLLINNNISMAAFYVPSMKTTDSSIPSSTPTINSTLNPTILDLEKSSVSPTETLSTSPSSDPTQIPTNIPTEKWMPCVDSDDTFEVVLNGDLTTKDCQWARINPIRRCKKDNVENFCPSTCGTCSCEDFTGYFVDGNDTSRNCEWIQQHIGSCQWMPKASEFCPLTCGMCTKSPSFAPSSSSAPSEVASTPPSLTISGSPSVAGSNSPSVSKSSAPSKVASTPPSLTISGSPSVTGSNSPSVSKSSAPSLSPTATVEYSESIEIGFQSFTSTLDDVAKTKFEEITKNFLMSTKHDDEGISVDIISVQITSQTLISGVQDGVRNKRRLQNNDILKGLIVALIVTVEVSSKNNLPRDFSLSDASFSGFYNNFTEYNIILGNDPEIYASALAPSNNESTTSNTQSPNKAYMLYIFIGSAVAGGMLLIYLAIMFINRGRRSYPGDNMFQNEDEFVIGRGLSKEHTFKEGGAYDQTSILPSPQTMNQRSYRENQPSPFSSMEESDIPLFDDLTPSLMGSHFASSMSDSDQDSMGLNVSPHAISEAQRNQQQFYYVPKEQNQMVGLFPQLGESEDYLDTITFDCDCPPGPLGLIIDTTTRGPVIHYVKDTSSIRKKVCVGDLIIKFDGKDTRHMTAPLITSLMAKKSQEPCRRLTILRFQ